MLARGSFGEFYSPLCICTSCCAWLLKDAVYLHNVSWEHSLWLPAPSKQPTLREAQYGESTEAIRSSGSF